jgi:surfactin synthase thioesterase subunit
MLLLLASLFSISANAATLTHTVNAGDGLTCNAYLFVPDQDQADSEPKRLPLVAIQTGTGIYTHSDKANISFGLSEFYEQKKIVVLMMDKPGITANPTTTDGFDLNRTIFTRYTIKHLIECEHEALIWAKSNEHVLTNSPLYLFGHSEGAVVMVQLLSKLVKSKSPLVDSIKAVFLSGTPMEGLKEIVDKQVIAQGEETFSQYTNALITKNDEWFMNFGETGYAWMNDIIDRDSLITTMRELRESSIKIHFKVFQGLNDILVKPEALQNFETENFTAKALKKPTLNFDVHYFNSDHNWLAYSDSKNKKYVSNMAEVRTLLSLFSACLNNVPYVCD